MEGEWEGGREGWSDGLVGKWKMDEWMNDGEPIVAGSESSSTRSLSIGLGHTQ